jgi:3-phosphoshikimate 1-carboxyvinyltransferase
MQDPYAIQPFQTTLKAAIALPGSKSITNRALILAALAEGKTTLQGALFSRDTKLMLKALQALGFECQQDPLNQEIHIHGKGGQIPAKEANIHVGNAGTAARFLTAFLALAKGGCYHLDGDEAMRERPMQGLIDALIELQAAEFEFHGQPGHFPFTLKAKGYPTGESNVDARSSSQILSALLMAAPADGNAVTLNCPSVRPFYVAITQSVREAFGATTLNSSTAGQYSLAPVRYQSPGAYPIEPDLSAASYFLALSLLHGGKLQIAQLPEFPIQGDAQFKEILAHHGLTVTAEGGHWEVLCSAPTQIARDHREIDFNSISDTFLTYAAIAPLLGASIRITGIGHTRLQETDRIAGMANELSKLGQLVKEEPDALTIWPKPNELRARAMRAINNGTLLSIDTYEDHRFAMSFAILGSFDLLENGQAWLAIKDPGCCGKTFPNFFEVLERVRQQSASR